jgi:hypothetical protein
MYHPLNGHAVNSIPPISSFILETVGTQYHLRPRSANQSYLTVRSNKKYILKLCFCITPGGLFELPLLFLLEVQTTQVALH